MNDEFFMKEEELEFLKNKRKRKYKKRIESEIEDNLNQSIGDRESLLQVG